MEPELLEELVLIDGIRNAYPYYFMPINATGYDAMNTIQFDGEYELEIDNQTVDLNTLINPTVQFYFEEQELGDGILISEEFVSQLNNSLTYPITLSTDILCPIKTEDSQVLVGEDLIPFDSTTRLYKKDNLTFTVSGTHHYVNVFSRLIQPVLLIPYSQINEYIDCSQVGFCGILVFFDTQKDVDELKEQINNINEDIIIRYPAEENMQWYKNYTKTRSDVIKEAFIYTFIYAFLFAAYFIGVEFFFKKKDGSLFIDLEQTSHLYILSRMKSLIVWYVFIVIEVIVLAFKNTLPSSISFYIIFTSLFIALSASLIWAGYKLIYGRHKN
ncbi:MAG: hypothetical protein HUJ68_04590 [Clostridia bacterium]|nr:hypothetical protein [Clostridia bacterium]